MIPGGYAIYMNGGATYPPRLAATDPATGSVDTTWQPKTNKQVWSFATTSTLVTGLAIALGGVAGALAGPPSAASSGITAAGGSGRAQPDPARTAGPPKIRSASPSASPSIPGHTIANLDSLRVGQALGFTAPGVGPAAVVRLANGSVVAYSRVCTHAGCLVGYSPSSQLFVCPCHGAEFDPGQQADPTPGSPTSTPLQMIRVVVDKATGDVILPS